MIEHHYILCAERLIQYFPDKTVEELARLLKEAELYRLELLQPPPDATK